MILIGTIASSLLQNVDNGVMDPLQVITVGPSGASEINFTNIPGTYSHLQIRAMGLLTTTGSGAYLAMRFNSDTGSNYSDHGITGNGSTVEAYGSANIDGINFFQRANNMSTTNPSVCVIDVLDYANTNKYKTTRNLNGADFNGSGEVTLRSAAWRNTNAITSIRIYPAGSYTIKAGSQFAIYGIKGAA